MKTIICKKQEAAVCGAEMIGEIVRKKPDAVLAMACGRTMRPLWLELAELHKKEKLQFSHARILCVTEFVGVERNKTCRFMLENGLLKKVDTKPENFYVPDPADPEGYDDLIGQLGGIDLAIIGIGENCHIGYNEPGTLYDSKTHIQKLTERTKRQLLKRDFTVEDMPQSAVTMGVKTLTSAQRILMLAEGEDKAGAVYQMLYAKTTPYVPAAYLQIPLEVTVILDDEAAREL